MDIQTGIIDLKDRKYALKYLKKLLARLLLI